MVAKIDLIDKEAALKAMLLAGCCDGKFFLTNSGHMVRLKSISSYKYVANNLLHIRADGKEYEIHGQDVCEQFLGLIR